MIMGRTDLWGSINSAGNQALLSADLNPDKYELANTLSVHSKHYATPEGKPKVDLEAVPDTEEARSSLGKAFSMTQQQMLRKKMF